MSRGYRESTAHGKNRRLAYFVDDDDGDDDLDDDAGR